ncbi:ABC transporter ATP-binding protein [Cohnella thailandensis]|uniref:ABC transporter ATP-binding protein n=1 Tax=Cohnella thailandensis TaxID=557557 RepID=UPI001D437778|nr:energy-coupling factor transport system ATP-binding protein [Cohnella thailandensis]
MSTASAARIPQTTEPLVALSNVGFRYPGASSDALQGIDLTIERGAFVAVAGTNGSGKSTLCKTLNGLIPNYYVGDLTGDIRVAGLTAAEETVSSLSKKVAYVFQDFENQLVRPTVYEEVIFAPLNFGYPDYKERGERALALLGLSHLRDRWIWQLSGGQKHMTALAAALSLDPDLIIVDEPVAQLDPQRARLVYDKLKLLREQHGKTILVIEHHTEFIADYCDRVILMDKGAIRWIKPVREALSRVEELAELHILPPQVTLAAKRTLEEERQEGESALPYPVTLGEAAEFYRQRDVGSRLNAVDGGSGAQAILRGTAKSGAQEPVVRFDNVTAGYKTIDRTPHRVLKNVSLELREGDRIALVGSNGAGKSTLLKLISGIRRPSEGSVTVCGFRTKDVSPERLADYVSYIYQQPEEMFIEDNIRKDISYFLKARKHPGYAELVDGLMERLRLAGLADRDGRLLSGGQQRRATLAIGLAMRPTVMLLDEPTASLDALSRREVAAMLSGELGSVKTAVIATHDMQLVAEWANRVIVMHNGEVALDTDKRTLFSNSELLRQAGLTPPQITQLGDALNLYPPCLSVDEFVRRVQSALKEEVPAWKPSNKASSTS